jgi:hypothetical protein
MQVSVSACFPKSGKKKKKKKKIDFVFLAYLSLLSEGFVFLASSTSRESEKDKLL